MKINDDYIVEFHIIDCGGQKMFNEVSLELLGKANFVVYVCDISSPESVNALTSWRNLVKEQNQDKKLKGAVLANKSDLESKAAVDMNAIEGFASENGLEFLKVSAVILKSLKI